MAPIVETLWAGYKKPSTFEIGEALAMAIYAFVLSACRYMFHILN